VDACNPRCGVGMLYPPDFEDSHCRISRPQVQEALKLRRLADTGAGFGSHFWFRNSTVRMRRHSPPSGRHGSDANHGQVGNCDAPALAVYMVGTRVKHAPWVGPGPGDVARQNEGAGCPLFRCSVRTPAPPPKKNGKRSNGHFIILCRPPKTRKRKRHLPNTLVRVGRRTWCCATALSSYVGPIAPIVYAKLGGALSTARR
jgi:hypothetical protein